MKGRRILLWILGLVITLTAAVYQKMTGPTYPKKVDITINENVSTSKLLRSQGGEEDAVIILNIEDSNIEATLLWKHYPISEEEEWKTVEFKQETIEEQKVMTAKLPHQPPAGKLSYYFEVTDNRGTQAYFEEEPIVIRYKGAVPGFVLIPHIIFMFFGMFLANVSGLFAAFKIPQFKKNTTITLVLMLIGGLILGPIVQKYAFLEYWAGVPFGWDLTDNKLLIAFLAWLVAFIMNRKRENRVSVIIASLVTIIIFSIPHSMHGSELNRETGKVIQGFIQLYF